MKFTVERKQECVSTSAYLILKLLNPQKPVSVERVRELTAELKAITECPAVVEVKP